MRAQDLWYAILDAQIETGTPYMLEINPNCGVYYPPKDYGSADICLSLDPEGHEGFTRQLVAAALGRHRRLTKSS